MQKTVFSIAPAPSSCVEVCIAKKALSNGPALSPRVQGFVLQFQGVLIVSALFSHICSCIYDTRVVPTFRRRIAASRVGMPVGTVRVAGALGRGRDPALHSFSSRGGRECALRSDSEPSDCSQPARRRLGDKPQPYRVLARRNLLGRSPSATWSRICRYATYCKSAQARSGVGRRVDWRSRDG